MQMTEESGLSKYAFLDRDGTLIYEPEDTHQIDRLDNLIILEGVIEGLQELRKMGYQLFLVSNQDGLGTGSFPLLDFETPQNRMLQIFEHHGVIFDAIFICPHLPMDDCPCRKPKTGLLTDFLRQNGEAMDWQNSFVCGDRETDRQFAHNLGIRFVPMETNGSFKEVIRRLSGRPLK